MSGTTLERLQVIIEASATKYKKEMDAVAQKTQKAEAIVDRCMSRVNSIVGKANTGNAGGQDQRFLFEIICTSERSMEPGRSVRNGFLEICAG